jgi:hypothetical protein
MTINAERPMFRTHIADQAAKYIDWAAVERAKKAEDARAAVERRDFLYGRLFGGGGGGRDVAALRSEHEAQELFSRALSNFDNRLQVQVLRVAVDNRWPSVVSAFIKVWAGEHPIADTVQELWTLTTGRAAV